ncbi:MAG TPA: glycosyltransferase [Stenotrophomonas sp.]|nr:glycosyltransferase [Stenotrophomonas sp.]
MNFVAWIRRQALLRAFYRAIPQRWRESVADALSARANAYVRFPRTPAWEVASPTADEVTGVNLVTPDGPGVNLLGYIRGQFGLGESARHYARALINAGLQVRLYDVDLDLPHGWDDRSLEAWIGDDIPHHVSIIFVNPDFLQAALAKIGHARLHGHYLIACWFWELERIPDDWLPAIEQVDEILVASEFVESAFRRVTDKPVLRIPQPLGEVIDSGLQRADFGLEEGKFTFLVTFDFHSWIDRKNPQAALKAFKAAFPPDRDDVRLLVKSSNGFRHPDRFRELLNIAKGDSRIIVRDEVIDRAHVNALQRCSDAYVSLHRAEGLGLGLAECMAMGKPVIATNWSGNLEFMRPDAACLVDYRLVPVAQGEYPHSAGAHWAEADIADAARAMRHLADDPAAAAAMGLRGQRLVRAMLSPERSAALLKARIEELDNLEVKGRASHA